MFRTLIAAIGFLLTLAVCPETQAAEKQILVVASISPLGNLVRSIGGDLTEVQILISAGIDPHTFELSPKQALSLNQAQLVVFNGLQLEFWARGLDTDLKSKLVIFSELLGVTSGDAHIWLNPQNMIKLATDVTHRLCEIQAERCGVFEKRLGAVVSELDQLDQEIAAAVAKFSAKTFIAYHSAWSRFADRYGLVQGGRLRLDHSSEVRASDMLKLIQESKSSGARALFVDPFTPASQIEPLLEATELKKVELDELGGVNQPYADLMRQNLAAIKSAME